MLQDIRSNIQGTMAKIIIGLIIVSFSIFGIESILFGGGSSGVAEVNGEPISPIEVQQAVNTQKRQLIAMMGDAVDPAMLDDNVLGAQALDGLIDRRLQMQSAADLDLVASEAEIGRVIAGMEQFWLDGQFSPEVYTSVLASAGFTPAFFKQSLAQDLVLNQVRSAVAGSDFATPAELALNARIASEQRDVRYLTIPLERFRQDVDVTDEQVAAWYADNEANYMTEESVELEYIELLVDDYREPIAEDVLRQEFELAKDSYQYQPENRVSHILFEQGDGESDDAFAARVAEASQSLSDGADFAQLAGELSADIGSAAAGGDLGFSSGDAFPEEMEEAIAALEVGQVSEPVTTDAGVHLILLTERRAGETASFEEMRPQLEETLQLTEARNALLRKVEDLRDLAFNAENLNGPAQDLELEVETASGVTRDQLEGLFSRPSLIAAAFSEDVLELGHNSEVIELSPEHFVALRVATHNKPELMPLDTVREQIVSAIAEKASQEAIDVEALRAVVAINAGEGVESFAVENGYEWQVEIGAKRRNVNLPQAVLERAFELQAPTADTPVVDAVSDINGDRLVLALVRVTEGELDALAPTERDLIDRQVGAEFGTLIQQEYQSGLRQRAEITVF
ncbi:SurA N-terminal domain-containing protein [Halioglobus pacificus]|uniref:Periplasmic chaperone PpiD n=1 Tax=Parahalioglobus pacificus TaxID=930806 RepID=A0A919CJ68_9GAMM|nr:SurA N-terminal domain-containing protein [Halioglobus pacificus]GHD29736.1 peptidylprolyl isomerase [Halioglobus pacificus]